MPKCSNVQHVFTNIFRSISAIVCGLWCLGEFVSSHAVADAIAAGMLSCHCRACESGEAPWRYNMFGARRDVPRWAFGVQVYFVIRIRSMSGPCQRNTLGSSGGSVQRITFRKHWGLPGIGRECVRFMWSTALALAPALRASCAIPCVSTPVQNHPNCYSQNESKPFQSIPIQTIPIQGISGTLRDSDRWCMTFNTATPTTSWHALDFTHCWRWASSTSEAITKVIQGLLNNSQAIYSNIMQYHAISNMCLRMLERSWEQLPGTNRIYWGTLQPCGQGLWKKVCLWQAHHALSTWMPA